MLKNRTTRLLLAVLGLLLLAVAVYNIPFVNDKLSWRLDDLRAQIIAFFRPPDEAVFVPGQQAQIDRIVTATLLAMQKPTLTPTPPVTATSAGPTPTPTISPTPTVTPTPLPTSITLTGVKYIDQTGGYNLCGPSNLAMALKFWKWNGTRDEILWAIKPGINDPKLEFFKRGKTDKNVMPYEMADFVNEQTKLRAIWRYGGSLDLLKSFIAAGYPMLIEKGEFQLDVNGKVSWMGHYQFITGYNDATQTFLVQDTYKDGPNFKVPYAKLSGEWRAFNYVFMVIFPSDRETQVNQLLGNWSDEKWADQHALDLAEADIKTVSGLDAYFAWFNKGTSHNQLLQYFDAASAYDQAFTLYPNLPLEKDKLPYRMLWYQTGPYRAYFYSGRYQDVINLANVTLSTVLDGPTLEESLYWRGMAEQASGDLAAASADFQRANHLNPRMTAIIQALQNLGLAAETPVK
jgi:tetratricopeptide (TPR) repeat protein